MPFEDNFFDFVTANLVLNNLEEQAQSLQEIYRVLKPGGSLHLTSNLIGHMQEFYNVFSETLSELDMEYCNEALQKNIEHRLTEEIISGKLESAGFKVINKINDKFYMRFADGTALLNHSFIIIGFMDGWKNIIPNKDKIRFFTRLEENLNKASEKNGELKITIPMFYSEAIKN